MKYLLSLVLLLLTGSVWADEYYCLLFATNCSCPKYCHIWGTFVQMQDDRLVKEITLSWAPIGGWTIRDKKKPGYNMSLVESFTSSRSHATCVWGPFAISEGFFRRAEERYNTPGNYKMLDAFSRDADNCIHYLSGITGKKLITHVRYGKYAGSKIYKHYLKNGLIQRVDGGKVIKVLGLNRYPLRMMVK